MSIIRYPINDNDGRLEICCNMEDILCFQEEILITREKACFIFLRGLQEPLEVSKKCFEYVRKNWVDWNQN